MPNHRFFSQHKLSPDQSVILDKPLANHINKVLRLGDGAPIELFDGDGFDYQARLEVNGKQLIAVIHGKTKNPAISPIVTHLGQAICRNDRMDYSIQKAVELGVNAITPIITERVQFRLDAKRLAKKQQHWSGIIHSACEQSGRADIPELNPPVALSDWLASESGLTLMLDPSAEKSMGQLLTELAEEKPSLIRLAIGPEGGFSPAELEQAQGNIQFSSLGPRILRTETAGTSALTLIQNYLGDFQ